MDSNEIWQEDRWYSREGATYIPKKAGKSQGKSQKTYQKLKHTCSSFNSFRAITKADGNFWARDRFRSRQRLSRYWIRVGGRE